MAPLLVTAVVGQVQRSAGLLDAPSRERSASPAGLSSPGRLAVGEAATAGSSRKAEAVSGRASEEPVGVRPLGVPPDGLPAGGPAGAGGAGASVCVAGTDGGRPAAGAPLSTVEQRHAASRGAASRGDCERVRTLSRQMAELDGVYHLARVARDPALARGLAARGSTEPHAVDG